MIGVNYHENGEIEQERRGRGVEVVELLTPSNLAGSIHILHIF